MKPFAVIVSLMFLVFFSVSSDAFVYTDTSTIDFTDNNAHRFHDFGDGHYSTDLVLGAIGGPSSNDSMGYASQFSVLERTHLTTINYDMHTVSDSISQNRQIFFDFIIYEGNVYNGGLGLPNTDKVLYRSPVELNFDIVGTKIY